MQRGKLIAVEGGEGSGKSTFVSLFRDDPRFRVTREPGGSMYAERIREVILNSDGKHASGRTMLHLFAAARCDHFEQTVVPALLRGENVISDRLDASTFAYQIYGQEAYDLIPLFNFLRRSWISVCEPSCYLWLDVFPEVGFERRKKASLEAGEDTTHFDDRNLDFHCRLREGFHVFLRDKPHYVINANQPMIQVFEEGKEVIESLIA